MGGWVMVLTALTTRDGKLDKTDRDKLDALEARIAEGEPRILLHLHGGLVTEEFAREMADRLSGVGDNAYNADEGWEQVYILWRTGALETLRTNWRDLAENDRLYRTLVRRLISLVSEHVGPGAGAGRGTGAEPLTAEQIEAQLQPGVDRPFREFDDARGGPGLSGRGSVPVGAGDGLDLAIRDDLELNEVVGEVAGAVASGAGRGPRPSYAAATPDGVRSYDRLDRRIQSELNSEAPAGRARSVATAKLVAKLIGHVISIGKNIVARYRLGRDHGLHATIAEEIAREFYGDLIGSIVWGMMKSDAADHFREGGLGAALIKVITANPKARFVIVGHSAGSIFASELLLWAARVGAPLKADVVFLAPAVRMTKFAEALDAAEGSINRFRLYAMKDELERADHVLGDKLSFIYPSSLLYLVSGLFEEEAAEGLSDAPLLGMQRFLEGNTSWDADEREGKAIRRVRGFLAAAENRTVFSKVTGEPGLSCDAISHGGFDDEKATLASVATFLA